MTGFAPFKVEIALDDAGKIVSVSVPENNETPGLGADLIADQSVFDALVMGMPLTVSSAFWAARVCERFWVPAGS